MDRRVRAVTLLLTLVVITAWAPAARSERIFPRMQATPDATPGSCPVTQSNGNEPPPIANVFGRGPGDYGNDVLWTSLWMWGEGEVRVDDQHVLPDGSFGDMKWAWYRYLPGRLTIDGRRLDASAPPLRAVIPDGYGDIGFQVSGLIFPTGGCWEVTGHVGGGTLTFVTMVLPPGTWGTPTATP